MVGNDAKEECLVLNDGKITWNSSCSGNRRHICYMDEKPSSTPCTNPYYNIQKCVKYFPNAGLLNLEDAKTFCDLNGGKLPEFPPSESTDPDYVKGRKT